MAVITDYASLQTAVGDYLARSDLSGFIPNFIQNAENKTYRRLNIRAEEQALSVSVSSGVGALPTRFKKLRFAYVDESPIQILDWMPLEDLYRKYPVRSGANTPVRVSRQGNNFVFGEYPKDFTMTGTYYQKFEPLRTTDGNWYVTDAPEVLLYGALLEAEPFIKNDPRIPVWRSLLADAIDSIETEETSSKYPSGSLRARVA